MPIGERAIWTGRGFKLQYRDLGLKNVLRGIRAFGNMRLRVGVVGPKASETTADGRLTNAENAVIQAFGLGGAPRRDFLNGPFTKNKTRVKQVLASAARLALTRSVFGSPIASVEEALDDAGRKLAQIPRDAILNRDFTPNAPSTVERKGFNHPLVDHLDLFDSISHRVVRESGDVFEAGATEFEAFEISGDVNPNAWKVK